MSLFSPNPKTQQLQPAPPESPAPLLYPPSILDLTVQRAAHAAEALSATLATLKQYGHSDGPQLADGSRWTWQAHGTVDGVSVMTASDGGVWQREIAQTDINGGLPLQAITNLALSPTVSQRVPASHSYSNGLKIIQADLSQANTLASSNNASSYAVYCPNLDVTPDMAGRQISGAGIPANTYIVNAAWTHMFWINQPINSSATSAQITVRPRDWGRKTLADPNGAGVWLEIEHGAVRDKAYAYDFGVRPQNDKNTNKQNFIDMLNYCYAHGIYYIVLPGGRIPIADNIDVSCNMRITSESITYFDVSGNTDYLLKVRGVNDTTADFIGQQMPVNMRSGLSHFIIKDFQAESDYGAAWSAYNADNSKPKPDVTLTYDAKGILIGNDVTTSQTAGSNFEFSHLSMMFLNTGLGMQNNNWCIHTYHCQFDHCFHAVHHYGVQNSGENITFTACTFNEAGNAAIMLDGAGAGITFNWCSVDNNLIAIDWSENAAGYDVHLNSCWNEYDSLGHTPGVPQYRNLGAGARNNTLHFRGTFFIPHDGAAEPIDNSMAAVPIYLYDCVYFRGANKSPIILNNQVMTLKQGAQELYIPMIWCSDINPPLVIPMSDTGGVRYWIDTPSHTDTRIQHNFAKIKLSGAAPTDLVFSIRY